MKVSKAEFLRWLTPGKEVRLINCLLGPCDKPRTVKSVKGPRVEFDTPDGRVSHLHLTSEEEVEKTESGYRLVLKSSGKCCAEYAA